MEGAYRYFEVDLDLDPESPRIISHFSEDALEAIDDPNDPVPDSRRVPVEFPYKVSKTDTETFSVRAYALDCDCEWTIRLAWQFQDRSGWLTVDDGGQPFRTVATSNATATCYGDGAWDLRSPTSGPGPASRLRPQCHSQLMKRQEIKANAFTSHPSQFYD